MGRPPSGAMVLWRAKGTLGWRFGYVTYVSGHDLIRLGRWNGDTTGGHIVSCSDIEWRKY